MTSATDRFKLTVFDDPNDQLDAQNYRFAGSDRVLLDRLLRYAVEAHVHTGTTVSVAAPASPELYIDQENGTLPANSTIYYRYSLIDARGQESLASASAAVTLPAPASAPQFPPRLAQATGVLEGGEYLYAVSACTYSTSQETLVGPTVAGTLNGFGGWNLTLPPLPSGAQFFNIYRKGPLEDELTFLATTPADAVTYIDTGATNTNPLRLVPRANTTFSSNRVRIVLPNPTPTGSWTWKVYRTFDPSNWDLSLLDWLSGTTTTEYYDDGRPTRAGYPPASSAAVGGAPRIRWATETEGIAPPGLATPTRMINFSFNEVTAGPGTWAWVNEYDRVELVSVRATLGRGSVPAATAVQVGLDRDINGTWTPVTAPFNLQPTVCTVPVGQSVGAAVNLTGSWPTAWILRGDRIRPHIWQTGGGPEPTDYDLTVVVTMRVQHGSTTESYTWEST